MMEFLNANPQILAIVIFFARIIDVSLGTVRTIMVFRGYRLLSAAIGFVEVLIWILAAGQVVKNLSHWYLAVAYAGGFAAGNVVGIYFESKLAIGNAVVTAISEDLKIKLTKILRDKGYIVTELIGKGHKEVPVEITLIAEKRRNIPELLSEIEQADPNAFYTVEDLRHLRSAYLKPDTSKLPSMWAKRK